MSAEKISVIIVTYNAEGFITFCIDSLLRSTAKEMLEIIVVDNQSADSTLQVIAAEFPQVKVLANSKNVGFSKACNQGGFEANGNVLLFLNPDCIVSESAISLLKDELNKAETGMAGPLFIDGAGIILPESAREIPSTPGGITRIFRLPFTDKYPYYRTINIGENIESPVLCGACMMISAIRFKELKGFDEQFFMYGEDVDLSVRVINQGVRNVCVTRARVIHFKGESTDKKKLENNENFFKAIRLFYNKHQSRYRFGIRQSLINFGTRLLSVFAYFRQGIIKILPVVIDFSLILLVLLTVQYLWSFIKSGQWDFYSKSTYLLQFLLYSFIWITSIYIQGAYFKSSHRSTKFFKDSFIGGLAVLIVYALLPDEMRFSRMIIILSIGIVPLVLAFRYLIAQWHEYSEHILVTDLDAHPREEDDLFKNRMDFREWKLHNYTDVSNYTLDFNNLDISSMIEILMSSQGKGTFEFWDRRRNLRFSSKERGKQGKGVNELSGYNLSQDVYLLHKRIFDIAVIILLFIPLTIIKILFLRFDFYNIFRIFYGHSTLIGYSVKGTSDFKLPELKESIVNCYDEDLDESEKLVIAKDYAYNYTIFDDIFRSLTHLRLIIKALL